MKTKKRQSLDQILKSVSVNLFPHLDGKKKIKVNSQDVMGDTPLHIIVRRQDRYGVARLLEAGAKPNRQGDMGETPLHVAISGGDVEIVRTLIDGGANPDIECEFGDSPRQRAIGKGKEIESLFKMGV